jgi:soluble lytic murein transglycosylase-like protein
MSTKSQLSMNLGKVPRFVRYFVASFFVYTGILLSTATGATRPIKSKSNMNSKRHSSDFSFQKTKGRASNPKPQEIYAYIIKTCETYEIDPTLVYAIAMAESSLNPAAQTNVARGMMQLTRGAWVTISDKPYSNAWDWKSNIEAGVAYLAFCKKILLTQGHFNHANLAAAYHYGPNALKRSQFDIAALRPTHNAIYKKIFQGYDPSKSCDIPTVLKS